MGPNHASASTADPSGPRTTPAADSTDPGQLSLWTEFHEKVKDLPDELRESFELLWYQGLTQTEVADLLGVSTRTVQRRRVDACQRLRLTTPGASALR